MRFRFSPHLSSSLFSLLFWPHWEELKSLMALGTKDLLNWSVEQLCDSNLPLNMLLLSMMMVMILPSPYTSHNGSII